RSPAASAGQGVVRDAPRGRGGSRSAAVAAGLRLPDRLPSGWDGSGVFSGEFSRQAGRGTAADGSTALPLGLDEFGLRADGGRGLAGVRGGGVEPAAAAVPGVVAATGEVSLAQERRAAGCGVAGLGRRGGGSTDR